MPIAKRLNFGLRKDACAPRKRRGLPVVRVPQLNFNALPQFKRVALPLKSSARALSPEMSFAAACAGKCARSDSRGHTRDLRSKCD